MASALAGAIIFVVMFVLVMIPYALTLVEFNYRLADALQANQALNNAYIATMIKPSLKNNTITLKSVSTISVTLLYVVDALGGVYVAGDSAVGSPLTLLNTTGNCMVYPDHIIMGPGCTVTYNVTDPTRLPVSFVFNTGRVISVG